MVDDATFVFAARTPEAAWTRKMENYRLSRRALILGAAAGAASGALREVGIDDNFMKSQGATLQPGTAALCVLIRQMTPDKVVDEIQRYGGTLIKTNPYHENEAKLREALASAQKCAGGSGQ